MIPEGVKWNGKSRHQLKQKLEMKGEISRSLSIIEKQMKIRIEQLRIEANAEIIKLTGWDLKPEVLYVSYEECPDSVTGTCIFDTHKDPWKDDCKFCEQPLDRG